MSDQTFMFIITAGIMIGLTIALFISRGRRTRSSLGTEKEHTSTIIPSSNNKGYDNADRKVKKYNSDGKPIYED
jgi:hypothetical protein